MVCHSLLQWTTFCQASPPWPVRSGWPHMAWLSFIELDKAVVCVIRLTRFLWVWFQCVCPLMPSYNTYHLTWVSLTLGVGYLFTAAPAKHSRCSLLWMRDISSHRPSWPSTWGLECKSRKSRNTWSNMQIWPWSTEWSRAKTNRVLPRKCTGHSKHPLVRRPYK